MLAGILRDEHFEKQTQEDFDAVYNVKASHAKVIDALTRTSQVQFFLLCSSIASGMGNATQSNYSLANSVLDDIALERNSLGFAAHSVQWAYGIRW